MREWSRRSSMSRSSLLDCEALNSFTGMLTNPKPMDPDQIALIRRLSFRSFGNVTHTNATGGQESRYQTGYASAQKQIPFRGIRYALRWETEARAEPRKGGCRKGRTGTEP